MKFLKCKGELNFQYRAKSWVRTTNQWRVWRSEVHSQAKTLLSSRGRRYWRRVKIVSVRVPHLSRSLQIKLGYHYLNPRTPLLPWWARSGRDSLKVVSQVTNQQRKLSRRRWNLKVNRSRAEAHHLTTSPPTQEHSPPRSLQSRSSRKRCSERLTEERSMSSLIQAKAINSKEIIRINSLTINKRTVAKIWIGKCINQMEECSKRTFSSRSVTNKDSNRTRGSNSLHRCQ